MSAKFGPFTLGSPYSEQQQANSLGSQQQIAQMQAGLYKQYVPAVMAAMAGRIGLNAPAPQTGMTVPGLADAWRGSGFSGVADRLRSESSGQNGMLAGALAGQPPSAPGGTGPTFVDLMLQRMRSEVGRGQDRYTANTMNRYAKSGMINSSLPGNAMATIGAEGNRQIAGQTADIYRLADEREAAALAQFLGVGTGQAAQAMSGYQGLGQQWGQKAEDAYGGLGMIGYLAGQYIGAGGIPALKF